MSAIRARNQDAMAQLYDRYARRVCSCASGAGPNRRRRRRLAGHIHAALAESGVLRCESRKQLTPWLAVSVRNRALDVRRKRRPQTDIKETIVSIEPDLVADADRKRITTEIRSTLQHMPAQQRSALEMAYFEGYSHSEIFREDRRASAQKLG
jgi:RNA polymerase sigma-70 factor, ECF subfamily